MRRISSRKGALLRRGLLTLTQAPNADKARVELL
jgi:hypothetical protein